MPLLDITIRWASLITGSARTTRRSRASSILRGSKSQLERARRFSSRWRRSILRGPTLVGPYAPLQVPPSGSAQPIVVGITQGGDVQQDILMRSSATEVADAGETGSFDTPRPLSKDGEWIGSLGGYGDADYFLLNGQANRTMAVEITALDENGNVTEHKAQPVIGIWSLAAPDETPPPAYTFSPFNIGHLGVTRLSAELLSGTQFRIGIADLRGDGRPDYRYRAHVLYGDTVTPARVSVQAGTPIALAGLGFKPGDTVVVGGANSTLLGVWPTQLTAHPLRSKMR